MMTLTEPQISDMLHAIGMDNRRHHRPYTRHGKKFYRPWRNYFNIGPRCKGYQTWVDLAESGLAEEYQPNFFCVTRKGLDLLGNALGIYFHDELR